MNLRRGALSWTTRRESIMRLNISWISRNAAAGVRSRRTHLSRSEEEGGQLQSLMGTNGLVGPCGWRSCVYARPCWRRAYTQYLQIPMPKIEHRDSRESRVKPRPDVCAGAAACSSSTRLRAISTLGCSNRGIAQISWNFDATRSSLINVLPVSTKMSIEILPRFDTYPFRTVHDNYDDKYFKKRKTPIFLHAYL